MKENNTPRSREYRVLNTNQAKSISLEYLKEIDLEKVITFGLPEIDDRYHIWRVPLVSKFNGKIGEVVIDAKTSFIAESKTTKKPILEKRLLGRSTQGEKQKTLSNSDKKYILSSLRNTIALGDSESVLSEMPAESVDLI